MITLNLKIDTLPDNLKCAKCKSVLKDACQVKCGCRFCRSCIDDIMTTGSQFCPGGSEECGVTLLSTAVPDYIANKSISKTSAICPYPDCPHECPLESIGRHLQVCQRKQGHCPFSKLGCPQDKLAIEEIGSHLQQETVSHSKILIEFIVNISMEMEMLRHKLLENVDEQMITVMEDTRNLLNENKLTKIDIKLIDDEIKSMHDGIRTITNEIKSIKTEIKSIKDENKSIQDDNKSIKDENRFLRNENKLMHDKNKWITKENKSIKRENKSIQEENKSITHEMKSIKNDIKLVKNENKHIKNEITSIKLKGLGRVDASCDWMIEDDVRKTNWGWIFGRSLKESAPFTGAVHHYKYRLQSSNNVSSEELSIDLQIYPGSDDSFLEWPFDGVITMTVMDTGRYSACRRLTRQCQIEKPPDNHCRNSDPFVFRHSELKKAGLDLSRGVLVACQIVPGASK